MSSEQHHQNPGYDTTPPASRRMLEVAVLVTGILVLLVPLFRSYFKHMMESELFGEQKIGAEGVKSRSEILAEQKARLESAPLSVSEAAKMLSTAGRTSSPVVAPQASEDLGALEGWGLAKNEAAVEAAKSAAAEPAVPAEGEATEGEAAEGEATEGEAAVEQGEAPASDVEAAPAE